MSLQRFNGISTSVRTDRAGKLTPHPFPLHLDEIAVRTDGNNVFEQSWFAGENVEKTV